MTDITRYDINEHGELPLSYGRYVRYEDYLEIVAHLQERIYELEDAEDSYENGYDDGWKDAKDALDRD
jgi:hypothetical protein